MSGRRPRVRRVSLARGEPAGRKVWSALACGRARCVAGTNNADFSAKEKAAERVPGR
jgi:hypothetical protein